MVPLSVLLFDPGFNVHCWGLASSASPIFESVSQHPCVSMGGKTLLWVLAGVQGHVTL